MRIKISILLAILLMLLSACTTNSVKEIQRSEIENEPFKLIIESEKSVYTSGEPLNIKAKLIYQGEENSTEISHGGSPISFSTTNITKDYQFGSAMNVPLNTTILKKSDPYIETYSFTGSPYIPDYDGEPYSEDEYNLMVNEQFPAGQYKITATTDFSQNKNMDLSLKLETSVIITIK